MRTAIELLTVTSVPITYKMPALTVTAISEFYRCSVQQLVFDLCLHRSLAVVYITLFKGVFGGVPLPDVCLKRRADRTLPNIPIFRECTNDDRVHRFFFSARRFRCKKFSSCPSLAVFLDEQLDADLNYFQDRVNCEEACTNGEYIVSYWVSDDLWLSVCDTELLFRNNCKPAYLGCLFPSCCSCGVFSGTIE